MPNPEAHTKSTIIPALRYRDAVAAIEWLSIVFGFEKHAVYSAPDGTIAHAELTLNGGMIMLGSTKDDEYGRGYIAPNEVGDLETRTAYIVVTDIDAVYARAQAAEAKIIRPLQKTDYGSTEFSLKDPEGHSWSVGTYDPWQTPS
jgi:uncharacterized glyoxalase superfamily protein PhnB